jgi:hypothetical protein
MTQRENRVDEYLRADEADRLTLDEAAKLAGIKRSSLFVWLKRGLPSVTIGGTQRAGRRYVLRSWLMEFLVAQQDDSLEGTSDDQKAAACAAA